MPVSGLTLTEGGLAPLVQFRLKMKELNQDSTPQFAPLKPPTGLES